MFVALLCHAHLFWHFLPNLCTECRSSILPQDSPRHPKTPRYPKPDQQISQLRHIRVCLASSRCILPSHRMGQRRRRRRRMLEAGTSTVAVFESKMQSGSESENLFTTKCIRMPVCFVGVVFVAASLLGTRLWEFCPLSPQLQENYDPTHSSFLALLYCDDDGR